jgi:hypothetical protein
MSVMDFLCFSQKFMMKMRSKLERSRSKRSELFNSIKKRKVYDVKFSSPEKKASDRAIYSSSPESDESMILFTLIYFPLSSVKVSSKFLVSGLVTSDDHDPSPLENRNENSPHDEPDSIEFNQAELSGVWHDEDYLS